MYDDEKEDHLQGRYDPDDVRFWANWNETAAIAEIPPPTFGAVQPNLGGFTSSPARYGAGDPVPKSIGSGTRCRLCTLSLNCTNADY